MSEDGTATEQEACVMAKITQTLISKFDWYQRCPVSWKDSALQAVKNTLTGEFTGSVATKRGDDFERKVLDMLSGQKTLKGLYKPCGCLYGMPYQQWINPLVLPVDGINFTFRGKMDWAGTLRNVTHPSMSHMKDQKVIIDMKTTGRDIGQLHFNIVAK